MTKRELCIAQKLEGKIQPRCHFTLILDCLGAQSEYFYSYIQEFPILFLVIAGLGCTSHRSGNLIPPVPQGLPRNSGYGITVDDSSGCAQVRKVDESAECRRKQKFGDRQTLKIIAPPVI